MADAWLVVGLGNPGPRFELTRHNVGQLVVDVLAERRGETFRTHKANARVAETWLRPGGPKLILAKPNTFMNVSGGVVAGLAKFYGIDPERVVVVHDELDIPFDTIKLKAGGGHGGHNGVRDVAKASRLDLDGVVATMTSVVRDIARADAERAATRAAALSEILGQEAAA